MGRVESKNSVASINNAWLRVEGKGLGVIGAG